MRLFLFVLAIAMLSRAAVVQLDRWEQEEELAVAQIICDLQKQKTHIPIRAAVPGEGRMVPFDYMSRRTVKACIRA